MFVWLLVGLVCAICSIMIAEAKSLRSGKKDEESKNVERANALAGLAILILMVIAGPLSIAAVLYFLKQYAKRLDIK